MEDIAYILRWNNEAEESLKPLLIEENIPFEECEMVTIQHVNFNLPTPSLLLTLPCAP